MSGKRLIIVASLVCSVAIWLVHSMLHAFILEDGSVEENLLGSIVAPDGLFGLAVLALCLAVGFITATTYRTKQEAIAKAELTRRNVELEALQSIAIAVGQTRNIKEILEIVLNRLKSLIPYDSASIAVFEHGQLVLDVSVGYPIEMAWHGSADTLLQAPHWSRILSENRPIIIEDTHQHEDWISFPGLEYIRCWLGVPLFFRDQPIGILSIDHSMPDFYNDGHAHFAMAVAQQAAAALENARLYQRLEAKVAQSTLELKSEKDRNETIVQNVADAIVFTDPDGSILYVNPAFEQLTGYTLQEAVGQNPRILQSGETDVKVYEEMWDSILHGNMWEGLLKNKRRDGSLYDAELKIAPVEDEDGVVQFFVALQRDVTAARQLEAFKSRFIADAAHDLGNPVGVLQFEVEMLKIETDRRDTHIEIIEHQVERLDHLVKDLLTLSRLDRGMLPTDLQSIDINQLIEQVVSGQEPLARQRQISLQLEKEPTLPPVTVDLQQIERTITNLISNALNYTPPGGTIWIHTGLNEHRVFFSVKDTGMGIPSDELPHIFDRFFRGKHAQDQTTGTGLGLAISDEIIRNHGGTIDVQSSPGEGSRFSVYLPIPPHVAVS